MSEPSFVMPSVPELGELVAGAMTSWAAGPVVLGCRHVVRDGAGAWLCACHPAAGLMCRRCGAAHTRRHDDAIELQCDVCGDQVPKIHGVNSVVTLTGTRVRDTAGYSRVLTGPVGLFCIGACPVCFDDLKQTA